MAQVKYTNNADTTLAGAIGTGDTTITVGSATNFPSLSGGDWFYATISEGSTLEIVKVTATSGTNFTVTRAQDGTSAASFTTSARVSLRVVRRLLEELVAAKATILATSRNITIGTDASGSATFDGSADITINITIANNAVSLAKMAQVATATILGRSTAGTGNVEALSGTSVTALLDLFSTSGTTKGLVPGSNGVGATYFLNGNGAWSIPAAAAAGSNTHIQFNNSGVLGGSANFTYNGTDVALGGGGALIVGGTVSYGQSSIQHTADNAGVSLRGGATGNYANLTLFGASHASKASRAEMYASRFTIFDATGLETLADLIANGAATLYHDNTARLATTATGVDITGVLAATGAVSGSNLSGTNTGDQTITLTGDVTGSGTGSFAATIAANAVTLAKFQQVATGTILGRNTAATGNIEVLTTLPTAVMPAHTGDVTSSAGSLALTIANSAVTLAKMADVATASVFYRKTAGTGAPEVQTLATLKTDLGLTGTNSGDQTITLTGDVTGSGTGSFAATIAANAVTLAKFQQVATATILGRNTAATGNIEVLTTLPTGVMPAHTGDVTSSAGSLALTIANSAVTLAKMADVATGTVFYRKTAGTGAPEVQTLATLKTDLGLTGTNSGDQTSIVGITGTIAQFNTACTDADFATGGGTATGTNTGDQTITLTGNVTGSGTGSFATTIANNAVTLAMMADIATASFLGRNTAATGDPEVLSIATAKTMLNLTGTNSGDQTITLTGDVTGSGTASFAATIANNAVTLAKFQQVATGTVLGRSTAATGNIEVLTTLPTAVMPAHTGDVTSSAGSLALTIANDAVTYAKMQNISTTQRVLGRNTAGAGDTEEVTLSQLLDWVGSAGNGDMLARSGGSWTRIAAGTSGQYLKSAGTSTPAWADNTVTINYVIDGGGAAITTGVKGFIEIPFGMTITGWTIMADVSGSIVVDVWKDTYANFAPTVADTIAGSEKPTLSSAQKNQDLALSTWTTSVTAGDILAFNVDSATTVTRVTVAIRGTRT